MRPQADADHSSDVFYDDGKVYISRTLLRFEDTSYPASNISSFRKEKIVVDPGCGLLTLGAGVAIFGGLVFSALSEHASTSWSATAYEWMSMVAIVLGIALSVWAFIAPDEVNHRLFITTNAGEKQAYESADVAKIDRIISSLHQVFDAQARIDE